jgi:hypothetical protein
MLTDVYPSTMNIVTTIRSNEINEVKPILQHLTHREKPRFYHIIREGFEASST